jgi:hypothetical protein
MVEPQLRVPRFWTLENLELVRLTSQYHLMPNKSLMRKLRLGKQVRARQHWRLLKPEVRHHHRFDEKVYQRSCLNRQTGWGHGDLDRQCLEKQ